MFSLIVAMDSKYGIGKNNTLPWNQPNDMAYFKEITSTTVENKQNVIIMGRNTWNSIPENFRPLKGRINIILSRTIAENKDITGLSILNSIDDIFPFIDQHKKKINKVFIIGGESIYRAFLKTKQISSMYITQIPGNYNCDTFFPSEYLLNFRRTHIKNENLLEFYRYDYINHDEEKYLSIMEEILNDGIVRNDRTKVGTISSFGKMITWDMSNNIMPILTTKRTFYRGIAEELLWFLKGSTDARKLQEKNVHIWDGNSSREFLDSRGLTDLPTGDIGAGYGFQLRHFGAKYVNCNEDYSDKGFDQLQYVVDTIKYDPHSRRILFSYWNPTDFNKMALFPCHIMYQFYVDTDKKTISCNLYQRSSDYFLANNFNVVSAVILTHMIGKLTGYTPYKLNHMLGDVHIYQNHIEQCNIQLERNPTCFPRFFIKSNKNYESIHDFTIDDFDLQCYFPQSGIKAPMAV